MEEAVYNELKEVCRRIIDTGPEVVPSEYLLQLRELEEKLILLDYLRYRKQSLEDRHSSPRPSLDEELKETLRQAEMQVGEKPVAMPEEPRPAPEPEEEIEPEDIVASKEVVPEFHEEPESPKRSINQSFAGGHIKLGLNDRLAFTKHLFAGSQEDLNRVVSQLNTFSNFAEANSFINEMVKPEYNWEPEGEYEERFVDLIKARFGED